MMPIYSGSDDPAQSPGARPGTSDRATGWSHILVFACVALGFTASAGGI